MATGKHHTELIVLDGGRAEKLLDRGRDGPFAFEEASQLGSKRARGALAAKDVQNTVFGRGHEPGGWVFRHAAELPDLQRAAEGVLNDVFRQREVVDSEDARQSGDHPPGFPAEQVIARLRHMFICMIGRTSTVPSPSKIGQLFESSTA